jgi:hypothetical protein
MLQSSSYSDDDNIQHFASKSDEEAYSSEISLESIELTEISPSGSATKRRDEEKQKQIMELSNRVQKSIRRKERKT